MRRRPQSEHTAIILPFPSARRVDLVHSIARRALELRQVVGERHIVRSIDIQAQALRRKGASESDILREMKLLEAAVRTVMWEAVMQPRETR